MRSYDPTELGKFLKRMRQDAGFTQLAVANELGYKSPQLISNMERGAAPIPLKRLVRMLKLYKVSPEILIDLLMTEQEQTLRDVLQKYTKAQRPWS